MAFLKRWLLEKPTRSASSLTSLLQSIRLKRRSLLLLQSHHTPRVFLAPQSPPRKGTGPGAALPDAFIEPYLATWAQLADLSFLNHRASTSIEIPSSCAWISGLFFDRHRFTADTFIQDRSERPVGLALGLSSIWCPIFYCCKEAWLFIGGKALSPQAAPILLVAAGQRDACYHCRFKKPQATFL